MRAAIATMPVRDVMALVRQLPPGSATVREELGDRADWNHTDANLADLVDLLRYWLWSEYARWTTDPDDPQLKREAERRKRAGIKPPPAPLIEPVAHRPPSVADAYAQQYLEQMVQHSEALSGSSPAAVAGGRPGSRFVPMDEFDRVLRATSNDN